MCAGYRLDVTVDRCSLCTDGFVIRHARLTRPTTECSSDTGPHAYALLILSVVDVLNFDTDFSVVCQGAVIVHWLT